ncbi:unnamed protein product [Tetraodon nigroviridis]|uniref:(spotted green pufferfish) hypothetical protein n=1 Tax=Tetraodon nigroviridis TaxID=99883 RepID=Q4T7N9_TETNG|nr:unnamed protein product [Tetraodon nigroviridis]
MTSVRQRKGSRAKESQASAEPPSQPSSCCSDHQPESSCFQGDWSWKAIVWTALGLSVSVGLGLLCCIYVATLHENDLWFSNIKVKPPIKNGDWSWKAIVWTALGLSVSVGLGLLCCIYVATLHENDLWFSNIKVKPPIKNGVLHTIG